MGQINTKIETVDAMRIAADKELEIKFRNSNYTRPEYDTTPSTNVAIARLLKQRREIAVTYFKRKNPELIRLFELITIDIRKVAGL